ncbi:para-aminobenzoate synthetase component I [Synechococcus sp. A15-127]|uniref:anthranilate synthase component I family protein n=1 Tax=Synechococcus sp. A15-127 TaxID=1050624 RepID=UPI0016457B30|nr:anthranilate synthase component I family protein [Synechococcus sp. A15-127]QNI95850.1 para-aminobenzoate synthetase component I [Synechococcus sp. A15-127]
MITPQWLELPWREPVAVARQLAAENGERGLIWLDGDGSELGHRVTIASTPREIICCRGLPGDANARDPFAALHQLGPGHWTGWLSYEAAAWCEPGNPWSSDAMASLWIARHDPVLNFDLRRRELWVVGTDPQTMEELAAGLAACQTSEFDRGPAIPLGSWTHHTDARSFADGVRHIRRLIADGDLFQANLTACCSTTWPADGSALELFQRIRQRCPAPFAGLVIADNGEALLSSSPERFLQVDSAGRVQTRPIKGTRPRHPEPEQDADLAAELVSSDKDRAENVMIVDLLRNDLGRVCIPGSIEVPQLVGLESYASVHHLTSVVEGQLRQNLSWVDLLQACWPGGSISGAPKLRACQRLHELEPTSRGPYCGSLIRVDWDGRFDSNILIRSLMRNGITLRAHAGCGIVADSDPDGEAEELMWKLQPLLEALA